MTKIELTNEQIANLRIDREEDVDGTFFRINEAYLIRTVTHYWTGRVIGITPTELLLGDAAWIADTGRYHDCLKTGKLSEVEPSIGDVIVARTAIIDAVLWGSPLPLEQK